MTSRGCLGCGDRRPLGVTAEPCESCPYRRDVPSGVWHRDHYSSMRRYDRPFDGDTRVFMCHKSPHLGRELLCRGWLTVHAEHPAVRLLVARGDLPAGEVGRPVRADLYGSSTEAAEAGLADIDNPGPAARALIAELLEKGATP